MNTLQIRKNKKMFVAPSIVSPSSLTFNFSLCPSYTPDYHNVPYTYDPNDIDE